MVATIAAIADKAPHVLESICVYPSQGKASENGVYAFRLYHNGQEKVIIVDQYVPFWDFSSRPEYVEPCKAAFTYSSDPCQMYIALIEKAYAKVRKLALFKDVLTYRLHRCMAAFKRLWVGILTSAYQTCGKSASLLP